MDPQLGGEEDLQVEDLQPGVIDCPWEAEATQPVGLGSVKGRLQDKVKFCERKLGLPPLCLRL